MLVVDDDVLIRVAIRRALEPEHRVAEACDGRSALALIEQADVVFDLVLCDIDMPVMDGPQLWMQLCLAHPELLARVVFVTGGAQTLAQQAFVEERRPAVLAKPLRLETLRSLAAGFAGAGARKRERARADGVTLPVK